MSNALASDKLPSCRALFAAVRIPPPNPSAPLDQPSSLPPRRNAIYLTLAIVSFLACRAESVIAGQLLPTNGGGPSSSLT
jgi:hypothetical protein